MKKVKLVKEFRK